jgi:hypothetical protein
LSTRYNCLKDNKYIITQHFIGYFCPSKTTEVAYACESGTYSAGGQTNCTICPPAYACPSTTEAIIRACATGTFSSGGQSKFV